MYLNKFKKMKTKKIKSFGIGFEANYIKTKHKASWKYKDMDFSFKNIGMYFSEKISNGIIPISTMKPYVYPGDEMVFDDDK